MVEQLYLAGCIQTEQHRDYNENIAAFLRTFGFNVFMMQEQDEPETMTPNGLTDVVRKAIHHSRVIVAILYGDSWDAQTAAEINYACECDLKVIGLFHPESAYTIKTNGNGNNHANGNGNGNGHHEKPAVIRQCAKTIAIPADPEELVNPLISFINLYYIQRL